MVNTRIECMMRVKVKSSQRVNFGDRGEYGHVVRKIGAKNFRVAFDKDCELGLSRVYHESFLTVASSKGSRKHSLAVNAFLDVEDEVLSRVRMQKYGFYSNFRNAVSAKTRMKQGFVEEVMRGLVDDDIVRMKVLEKHGQKARVIWDPKDYVTDAELEQLRDAIVKSNRPLDDDFEAKMVKSTVLETADQTQLEKIDRIKAKMDTQASKLVAKAKPKEKKAKKRPRIYGLDKMLMPHIKKMAYKHGGVIYMELLTMPEVMEIYKDRETYSIGSSLRKVMRKLKDEGELHAIGKLGSWNIYSPRKNTKIAHRGEGWATALWALAKNLKANKPITRSLNNLRKEMEKTPVKVIAKTKTVSAVPEEAKEIEVSALHGVMVSPEKSELGNSWRIIRLCEENPELLGLLKDDVIQGVRDQINMLERIVERWKPLLEGTGT